MIRWIVAVVLLAGTVFSLFCFLNFIIIIIRVLLVTMIANTEPTRHPRSALLNLSDMSELLPRSVLSPPFLKRLPMQRLKIK